jgi:ABC-2 type transport system ATP-binding protein
MTTRADPKERPEGDGARPESSDDLTSHEPETVDDVAAQRPEANVADRPGEASDDVAQLDAPSSVNESPEVQRQRAAAALDTDAAVVAVDIGRKFGDQEVVKNLSFVVERGTIFGIIGPSGGGKTTTMRMLLGVLRPSTGELRVLGREPARFRRRDREQLGYMPQLFVLFPELSVMENMGFAASIYGMNLFKRGGRIRRVLDLVDLWDARKKTASELSGGMQRRLELAATLVHNPEIIFLDEPTAGIDPVLRARFWEHFHALRDQGRTLIVTTQYVTEAEYCDRVLVLKEGEEVANGAPEEIRRLAMGGEVVIVSGPDLGWRATSAIRQVEGVRRVRWLSDDSLEVIVEDAGTAVPVLIESLREADIDVDEVSEQHPSFDDVFVRLMGDDHVQGNR